MNNSQILFEIQDTIATITLNRPDKLNAISMAMLEQIEATVAQLENNREARVVIMTGAGDRAFSVGADINEWEKVIADDPIAMWRAWDRPGHRVFDRLARLHLPTIAAINGYAFGGGLELALATDLRIASDRAEFALPETKIGTQPGWTGSQRLPVLIGVARAKQMIFTGARIKADVAERWNLVNEVVAHDQVMARAREIANQIAANAPLAVQFAKTIVDAGVGQGVEIALEGFAAALGATTHDGKEGPSSFREKRAAKFTGR
ncbi:MAG: enoyl-CoA hydratase/isomerase family protein [Chloroflexi bacterium]|nr:enoyl-CoA hydratase/isomerase family protein [Chloroflexota bacterium]